MIQRIRVARQITVSLSVRIPMWTSKTLQKMVLRIFIEEIIGIRIVAAIFLRTSATYILTCVLIWVLDARLRSCKKQQTLGANLKIDGGMGPMTIGAMKKVELERVRAYRVKYYATLIERKPDLAKFYFGWFKRSLEV